MEQEATESYLSSLLNKTLRLHTTDTRMFVGEFKCTDNEQNVILSRCYEYRPPPLSALSAQAETDKEAPADEVQKVVKADMTSRFLGLVVVPGKHITRIEIEEAE